MSIEQKTFIERLVPLAQADMRYSGVLASITIAQACLESGYGTSELAVMASNLFGMKCNLSGNTWSSVWSGDKYCKKTSECIDGRWMTVTAEFRQYPDIETSIRDHSMYLTGAMNGTAYRYAGLAGEKDPRKAATIIKTGGYATDPDYVDKIMAVIDEWNLTQYDIVEGEKKVMKICLDAGHYGKYNQSPCNSKYFESEMVWKLHLKLKAYLNAMGIQVITTRNDQENDMNLYHRGAASKGCNLFVSLHSNACGSIVNNAIDYPVAYCAIDGSADQIGTALAQCVENVMETKQLARIEHRVGQHGDYYGVIRGATAVGTPGLILEHSFHTNSFATEWLLNDDNLDRLAQAEADTIALYYGIDAQRQTKKSGWYDEDGTRRFYNGDTGECVQNDWHQEPDGKWYWFDGSGSMVTNTWYRYNDAWYYLGSDGAMCTGLQTVEGKWYYLDEDGKMATDPVVLTPDADGALRYPELK
jgi:N-acetylmuramoyl-L-alanine amidase